MSISLKRVELSNIRAHSHVVFEPAKEGLTSIHGPNGAGKSTLVDSIPWVLFGTKPQGVSKTVAIVKEGTELGKDRCFASLDLGVDGRLIRIVRKFVSKNGQVECEVLEGSEDLDESGDPTVIWKNVAGPAVSHAEPYIRKLLRMDEKGFLAAILVQQKQVDQLISATPRERAAVIEKLTGIASVTAAVTESRQEYNNLRKMASFSTVNENELVELKKEKEGLVQALKELTHSHNALMSEEKQLKKRGAELAKEVETETEKHDAAAEAKNKLAGLDAAVEARQKELERVAEDKDAKKRKLSNLSSGGSLTDIQEKLRRLKQDVASLDQQIYSVKTNMQDLSDRIAGYEELIGKSSIKDLAKAEEGLKVQETKLEDTLTRIDELRSEKSAFASKRESLLNAIEVIRDGHGECPTCLQKVSNVKNAVEALSKDAEELEQKIKDNGVEIEKANKGSAVTRNTIEKFQQLVEALTNVEPTKADQEEAHTTLQELEGNKKALEGEVSAVERIHNELKSQEELKNEYTRLLARAKSISDEIETMKGEIANIKGTDFNPMSPTQLNKLRKTLETAREDYMANSRKLTEEQGEIKLLRERTKNISEKIEAQEEAVVKHKELLTSVEVASNSTQLLEEFRSNRIEHSVPLLEAYASDLLSRFTEGKFTRLKIDGKFNASVVLATGHERAIGLLSGGELSAAAMALRLAISMLLNGKSAQSLMVLDEVLVSQDATRAEIILSTIKDACRGQVVLIAHNDSVHQLSDKLVELV